jgi:hypothetical protein
MRGTVPKGGYFEIATEEYVREEIRTWLGIFRMRREVLPSLGNHRRRVGRNEVGDVSR